MLQKHNLKMVVNTASCYAAEVHVYINQTYYHSSACLFFCMVMDFSVAEKDSGVKLCMLVRLVYGQVFSHFGELWLANMCYGCRSLTALPLARDDTKPTESVTASGDKRLYVHDGMIPNYTGYVPRMYYFGCCN